ncbi:fimbrial protein [Enterobacter mori]|uniref:fimbrial protein n=1 Tax=Enterobacter mori TaxID=539813 RepID=UPI003B83AE89
MKKALMLSVVAGAMMSANALANPATVNFNGAVVAPTCTLTADGLTRTVTLNDVTPTSLMATSPDRAVVGSEVEVPVINFEKCPSSITSVYLSQVDSSGTIDTVGYIPEGGTGKGVALGVVTNGGYVAPDDLFNGLSQDAFAWEVDPATGTASTAYSVGLNTGPLMLAATKASTVTSAADIIPGAYNTTITLTFDWL